MDATHTTECRPLVRSDVMQRGSEVAYVVVRNTGDGNAAILGQVDMVLVHKLVDLLWRDTQEGKHADLVLSLIHI